MKEFDFISDSVSSASSLFFETCPMGISLDALSMSPGICW